MTISFPKFYSDAKFGHIYDVTIAVTWNGKKKNKTKQLTGSLSTFVPTEFRHIPCFLLLSMPYDSRF